MPRKPRIFLGPGTYHIMAKSNNKQSLFRDDEDYEFYLKTLLWLKSEYKFDVYHYCLLRDQVHLLIRFHNTLAFQKTIPRLHLRFAKWVRKKYNTQGHLFQDRYKSLPLVRDSVSLDCGRFIERWPLKRKLSLPAYNWSSYQYYSLGKEDKLITQNPNYKNVGETELTRQINYTLFVNREQLYDDLIGRFLYEKI